MLRDARPGCDRRGSRARSPRLRRRTSSVSRLVTSRGQLVGRGHLDHGALGPELLGDLLEVLHVRAHDHRPCPPPPARGCCGRPTGRGCRPRRPRWRAGRPGPARRGCRGGRPPRRCQAPGSRAVRRTQRKPAALDERGHLGEALGVARRQHEPGLRDALADATEGARGPSPPRPPPCCPPPRAGRCRRIRRTMIRARRSGVRAASTASNFRLPVTRTRSGGAPSSRIRSAWASPCMRKRSTSARTRAQEAADAAVAGERRRGDATVDDRDPGAAAVRLVDEVRPDLGLDEDEQRRVQGRQGPPHRARESRTARRRSRRRPAHALLGHRVAGHGGRGEVDRWFGKRSFRGRDQRPGGQHLPHRDRVDPDRAVAVDVEVDGQPPHPLAERPEVLAGGPPLPEEPREGEDEAEGEDDAIEEIHGSSRGSPAGKYTGDRAFGPFSAFLGGLAGNRRLPGVHARNPVQEASLFQADSRRGPDRVPWHAPWY